MLNTPLMEKFSFYLICYAYFLLYILQSIKIMNRDVKCFKSCKITLSVRKTDVFMFLDYL